MKIKILQWNVWFKEQPENIVKLIKELSPDIICLQELRVGCEFSGNIDVPEFIHRETGLNFNFALAHEFSESENQGNGIYSRFPITKNYNFFICNPEPPFTAETEGRICAVSELELPNNKKLKIATTHSSYVHMFNETENTIRKTNELNKLINYLKDQQSNFIFTGDLNLIPESKSIREIQNYLIHLGPDLNEATWTTKPFSHNGFKETKLKWRLDYAFGTTDIKLITSEVINTKFSDHLPILIEIEI